MEETCSITGAGAVLVTADGGLVLQRRHQVCSIMEQALQGDGRCGRHVFSHLDCFFQNLRHWHINSLLLHSFKWSQFPPRLSLSKSEALALRQFAVALVQTEPIGPPRLSLSKSEALAPRQLAVALVQTKPIDVRLDCLFQNVRHWHFDSLLLHTFSNRDRTIL